VKTLLKEYDIVFTKIYKLALVLWWGKWSWGLCSNT